MKLPTEGDLKLAGVEQLSLLSFCCRNKERGVVFGRVEFALAGVCKLYNSSLRFLACYKKSYFKTVKPI